MQVNQSIHRAALYSAACDRENRHQRYTDNKNEETEHKVCKLKYFDFAPSISIIRKLMQQRRRWLRKRHLKSYVALLKIYRDCSISFSSSNAGNFFLDLNSKRLYLSSGKEKESRCLEFTSSTKRGILRRSREALWRQGNVQKSVICTCKFVFFWGGGGGGQPKPAAFLKFSLTSPSSLLKVPIYSYRASKAWK